MASPRPTPEAGRGQTGPRAMWSRARRWLASPHRISIKGALLVLMLPGLALLINADQLADYKTMQRATDQAYDRSLRMVALLLRQEAAAAAGAERQPGATDALLHALTETAGSGVYFSMTASTRACGWPDADERLLAGQSGIPAAPGALPPDVPVFYDGVLATEPVRIGALCVPSDEPGVASVTLRVAETTGERRDLLRALWQGTLWRGLLVTAVASLLLWLAVSWALRPLASLRRQVLARGPRDLRPLAPQAVPAEVRPLVQAINHHVEQHQRLLDEQTRFLDGASHQLRTPLAVLLTQAEYALRESDLARVQESLRAMVVQLQQAHRLTAQLLLLARAQHQDQREPLEVFDLAACAQQMMIDALPLAHARGQDLGWIGAAEGLRVRGNAAFVREAIANLVHNAIAYTQPGGTITVGCEIQAPRAKDAATAWALVTVQDNGPGIAPDLRSQLFGNFVRGSATPGGSGLGLAISRSLAQRYGGEVWLGPSPAQGVCAYLRLPLLG